MGFRCITKWNFAILNLGMRAMETSLYTKYTKIWSGPATIKLHIFISIFASGVCIQLNK